MYIAFAISALVLVLLWMTVRGRSAQVRDLKAAEAAMVTVDLEAFRNLIDPGQDRYLREQLSGSALRHVQRERYRAVIEYLWRVAGNAGVVLRLGEAARHTSEATVVSQGADLASAALTLRLYCLIALAQAYAGIVLPGVGVSVGAVAEGYDRLTAKVWAIGRTWTPVRSAS